MGYPGKPGAPDGFIDADTARRYEDLGVDRLIATRDSDEAWKQRRSDATAPTSQEVEDRVLRFLEDQARELGIEPVPSADAEPRPPEPHSLG